MSPASINLLRAALMASVLVTAGVAPRVVQAAIYRCQAPDGGMVYTDRPCSELGATPSPAGDLPIGQAGQRRRAPPRFGCARNLPELVLRVANAINQQDTNQLAGVYHWAGMSGGQSVAILRRLDAVAHRPLAGIVQVGPQTMPSVDGVVSDEEYYAKRPISQTPVALRIEQSTGDGISPSNTVFGLQRHFGCWWIRG
ncbi:DUF4124 domain-containing protein [Lysobacter sp. H23M47]|uniref:DUF4124 domain-containing protein n=1 Tax=Lysobacter sp. H23M47 TaxID=2781024 RepID=UPI001880D63B|nr:DUF4124 domain-containing protein [Lysobacter sp. H23M47]QOW25062.1 DUF4124 domain-containing protein [Lysobacter sp. H23M47]